MACCIKGYFLIFLFFSLASAKESAPCIIFIDEFDSVGAKRTSSAVHPYANQTVNQLLNEMDGLVFCSVCCFVKSHLHLELIWSSLYIDV